MNENFNNLPTTRKGNVAEEFAIKWLESIGYSIYWNTGHQSQEFDGYGNSGTTVRNLIEVKCKYPTKHGSMSIHQNDLIKYLDAEVREGRQMIILYLDYVNGDINVITPKSIVKNTLRIVKDKEEKKNLVYFTGWKHRGKMPLDVCFKISSIDK